MVAFAITVSHFLLQEESPTVIYAWYDGDVNGFSITLKQNGEYKINSNSWLTTNSFYGTYTLTDSIIILDKQNIDNVIRPVIS